MGGRWRSVRHVVGRVLREEEGQDLTEYAFLLAFVAAVCILALQNLGSAVNATYDATSTSLTNSVS
jgi:Flp pilus assembly pilin Flp